MRLANRADDVIVEPAATSRDCARHLAVDPLEREPRHSSWFRSSENIMLERTNVANGHDIGPRLDRALECARI